MKTEILFRWKLILLKMSNITVIHPISFFKTKSARSLETSGAFFYALLLLAESNCSR